MQQRRRHVDEVAGLIRDVEVAMLTTVDADGRLVSRPLCTEDAEFDGELWFVTRSDSPKVAEIHANPHVNVAYAVPARNAYVSIAGQARIVHDPARAAAYQSRALAMFFPEGREDGDLCLVHVVADSAECWNGPGPLLGRVLHFVMSAVGDEPPAMSGSDVLDLEPHRRR